MQIPIVTYESIVPDGTVFYSLTDLYYYYLCKNTIEDFSTTKLHSLLTVLNNKV